MPRRRLTSFDGDSPNIRAYPRLNAKGFLQAAESGLNLPALTSGSASDTFLARNNNSTPEKQIDGQRKLRALYTEHGLGSGPVFLFTAFGCNCEGDIPVAKAMQRAADLVGVC
ncbi:hydroxymethylglutaryl-CoA lyase [Salipiger mucosus]|uniref:Hydroxymethylglutaryl-CoA lyase n=1 Tax=Salipiger mucosus DSM 16094 TaxID=1123237 RepID=S9RNY3_9RHOB|nr:hydroxymethylglutaryl-CoA lyase [Salipiger mucosus]EPX75689.1 Hydroxymethylglutaryl-CoA lyase [Salipiger mucosus DSM 16094]